MMHLVCIGALVAGFALAPAFYSFYLFRCLCFQSQRRETQHGRVPPTVPYALPFIGTALSFAFDTGKCLASTRQGLGDQSAYCIKLFNSKMYFLHGAHNIASIWKYGSSITTPGTQASFLINIFGLDKKDVNMIKKDNSGILPQPHVDSLVEPRNRIDYHTRVGFHKNLNGDGLKNMFKRWASIFDKHLELLPITTDWTEGEHMMDFWIPVLSRSVNEAIAGPLLECINPDFTRNFLEYLPYAHTLMKGFPKWCIPKAASLRANLIQTVRQWHAIARSSFSPAYIDVNDGADPWWGSAWIRERQKVFKEVDGFSINTVASLDFGLLWGANVNASPAAVWTIIEVFKDRSLLARVRRELDESKFQRNGDIENLLSLPLLQSVYAETLRVRVEAVAVLYSERDDIYLNEWRIPRKNLLLLQTAPAHMDTDFWNTDDGRHPVDRFWADRFLEYPDKAHSGPIQKTNDEFKVRPANNCGKPRYVGTGLANYFIPYGVGERLCPGRLFAKRLMIAFCAYVVQNFDVEILSDQAHFESNSDFFGIGTQRPKGKIPFRIRRRFASRIQKPDINLEHDTHRECSTT